jgi:hypothetical protein
VRSGVIDPTEILTQREPLASAPPGRVAVADDFLQNVAKRHQTL